MPKGSCCWRRVSIQGIFSANEQLLALYKRTHDSRAAEQAQLLKKLDEDRSKRAELMLRTIEFRP